MSNLLHIASSCSDKSCGGNDCDGSSCDVGESNECKECALCPDKIAAKWKSLPKGWTEESRSKFWDSLTGDVRHKVTKCIKKLKGKEGIDDPGAFCASLADREEGPEWRRRDASDDDISDRQAEAILDGLLRGSSDIEPSVPSSWPEVPEGNR